VLESVIREWSGVYRGCLSTKTTSLQGFQRFSEANLVYFMVARLIGTYFRDPRSFLRELIRDYSEQYIESVRGL